MSTLRLGTRASALARWQANWVSQRLAAAGVSVELTPISTRGDESQREAVANIGAPGVFTKELERALLDRRIDLAVHSLKDLPTEMESELTLAAVPAREAVEDVLVSRGGEQFDQLRPSAIIGTGSLRRRAQLLHLRPDLVMRDIRGNVDTRLAKVAAGEYDAIVLALAGLKRLELESRISQVFEAQMMLPAVGQGALGIQIHRDDASTRAAVAMLDDAATHRCVLAERALLAHLAGGCLAPIGACAAVQADGRLRLDAVVLEASGQARLAAFESAAPEAAEQLGVSVADALLAQGAARLIQQSRGG